MSLCFAESLRQYLEEQNPDVDPDDPGGSLPDDSQPPTGEDENEVWEPVLDHGYRFYEEYSDENYSVVDEDKLVNMYREQINFAQESNSQYIPFQMSRYYDGYDLTKAKLQFYYVNSMDAYGIEHPVNVYASDKRIRFAWLVGPNVTKVTGKIRFEIQAIGKNSKEDAYVWKTYPNGDINVFESLSGKTFFEPDESWQTDFFKKADTIIQEAEDAALEAKSYRDEIGGLVASATENINSAVASATESIQKLVNDAAAEIEADKQEALNAVADAMEQIDSLRDYIDSEIEDALNDSVDAYIAEKVDAAMSSYYTKEEIDEMLSDYYTKDEVDTAMSAYCTKDEVDAILYDCIIGTEEISALFDNESGTSDETE